MRYLGGKAKIARKLGPVVLAAAQGRKLWEPFMGGASMSAVLRPTVCSDGHPALISMYKAALSGWIPPDTVTEEDYRAARRLPDTDPRKAFIGFFCSFGGKYFGGYARGGQRNFVKEAHDGLLSLIDNPVRAAKRGLGKLPKDLCVYHIDFCDVSPTPSRDWAMYCDPPYAGTTGYAVKGWDSRKFWDLAQAWTSAGWIVLVSEYACPVPHEVLWEHERNLELSQTGERRVERLFLVK